jgi:hypothetical protein
MVMIADSFGLGVPEWVSPLVTFGAVGYFYIRSLRAMKSKNPKALKRARPNSYK